MSFISFLLALGFAISGAAPVFFAETGRGDKGITFVILTAIYTILGWWIFYGALFSFAWPLVGGYGFILFIWWVITAIVAGAMSNEITHATWFPVAYVVILLVTCFFGSGLMRSDDYASLIGDIQDKTQKHWSQDIQPLDPTHIRLVPEEQAISLAKTTLSQDGATLGSQFPLDIDHITLQKIKSDYWYLIPLDYKGWAIWTNANYVPAYVKISATDPYAKPILVTGKKMKYTPGAWYFDNMERCLFLKYKGKVLTDYSFEEDENGQEFWIITVCKPTITFWGPIVEGVIIFNPETGEDQFVSKTDLVSNKQYAWIDRMMPKELVESYVDSWGNYKDGWWNQFWSHINLLKSETPTMNYSSNGDCVFVTPVTSSSDRDQAMTGMMYTDARTGIFTYYATSGGATENAIIEAVNSTVRYKMWHANKQIVYENIYGKLSALVPVMGENGNYQGLAIVENENKRVAFGVSPQEALSEFQRMIMNSGGQITTENSKDIQEYVGKIKRIGCENSSTGIQYYIYLPGFKNAFIVSSKIQSELALTKEGDEVYIKYINTKQAAVPSISFKNRTLDLQASENEKDVNAQIDGRNAVNQVNADVKDFKESVKEMSNDQIQKIMDGQKK